MQIVFCIFILDTNACTSTQPNKAKSKPHSKFVVGNEQQRRLRRRRFSDKQRRRKHWPVPPPSTPRLFTMLRNLLFYQDTFVLQIWKAVDDRGERRPTSVGWRPTAERQKHPFGRTAVPGQQKYFMGDPGDPTKPGQRAGLGGETTQKKSQKFGLSKRGPGVLPTNKTEQFVRM